MPTSVIQGPLSANTMINAVLWNGWKWDFGANPHTISWFLSSDSGQGWETYQRDAYIRALASWSAVANISFTEAATQADATFVENILTGAQITYMDSTTPFAFHDTPQHAQTESTSDIDGTHTSTLLAGQAGGFYSEEAPNWSVDALSFGGFYQRTMIHELGHALGLSHPHDGIVFPGVINKWDLGTNNQNHMFWSIESYNRAYSFDASGQIVVQSGNNIKIGGADEYTFGYMKGPMAYDIAALQYLYGTKAANTGNDFYDLVDIDQIGTGWLCIWDTGGIDTLRYTGVRNAVLALTPAALDGSEIGGGVLSYAANIHGGFTIANTVTIENATGGSGNDTIILTSENVNNLINGNGGTDTVNVTYSFGSGYSLAGTAGDLVMSGAAGVDEFIGVEFVHFTDGRTFSTQELILPTAGSIVISDAERVEGDSFSNYMVFTVTRTGGIGAFSVNFATANITALAGSDYVATSGTLNFGPGVNTQTISVLINADTNTEPEELFSVLLSGATNGAVIADPQGTGTIISDDSGVSVADLQVTEGHLNGLRHAQVVVSRIGGGVDPFSVDYTTAGFTAITGVDFYAASGTLNFAANETFKFIDVLLQSDSTPEPDKVFRVFLSNATNGVVIADGMALVTIQNDDIAGALSISDATISEGDAGTKVMTFTVTRMGPVGGLVGFGPIDVDFAAYSDTATAGSDFVGASGTLHFGGQTSQTISVTINGDASVEADENFFVYLSNATNGATIIDNMGAGLIQNDDSSGSVSVADVSITEGNAGTSLLAFTVVRSDGDKPFSVNFQTIDFSAVAGVDYVPLSGTLNFAQGETLKTVAITINGDTLAEANETFRLFLSGATNGATINDAYGQGTILNDDAVGSVVVSDVSVTEGNSGTQVATFTVTRTGGQSAFAINYATADNTAGSTPGFLDYFSTSGTLNFGSGVNTQTISVNINGDTALEGNETFFVNLSGITNGGTIADNQGVGTIIDDDVNISITGMTITEGNAGTQTATFNVNRVGGPIAFAVNYATANGTATAGSDFVAASGTLNFGVGVNSQTISVTINGDLAIETNEFFYVNIFAATNGVAIVGGPAIGTINNDDYVLTDDYADNFTDVSAPFGQATVGASVTGALEFVADHDWYRVTLTAGTTYLIDLKGQPSAGGTLINPYVLLYDSNGLLLAQNDDDGLGLDGRLSFTATQSGLHYIDAAGYADSLTGTYSLKVAVSPFTGGADNVSLIESGLVWRALGGNDNVNGYFGADTIYGDAGNDTIGGGSGADVLDGGDGDDSLDGGGETDTLNGGDGNDTLIGGGASFGQYNLLNGDNGNDTASYAGTFSAVYADLNTHGGLVGGVLTDLFSSIENLIGGDGADNLNGDAGANRLSGGAGNDLLFGNAGNDTLTGGAHGAGQFNQLFGGANVDTVDYSAETGKVFVDLRAPAGHIDAGLGAGFVLNDLMNSIENVLGGSNDDTLIGTDTDANFLSGGAGTDVLFGFGGDDTLAGGSAQSGQYNQLFGGLGNDTADYSSATTSVYADINVLAGYVKNGGGALVLTDVYNSIENLIGGSAADTLVGGNSPANVITGGGGADVLYANAGVAVDARPDTFVYKAASDSNLAAYDTIVNFLTGQDKLDLTAFAINASNVTILSGGGSTSVYANVDGVAGNDLAIVVLGNNAVGIGDILF